MYLRFCLYTVLRNQQFYAPFILLALRQTGLTYTEIGGLYAIRSLTVNALEVPSGAMADSWGRRSTLALSMLAYCVSFLLLGLGAGFWPFAVAMVLFGVGEAFRTGTHKAMLYQWLQLEGRSDEKVTFYGRVRSWGKLGAALNVVLAGGLAAATGRYSVVFVAAIVPYALNALNVFLYPAALEGPAKRRARGELRAVVRNLWRSLRTPELRKLLVRSVTYDGLFKTTKDYVQPMIQALLPATALVAWMSAEQRTALALPAFYLGAHLLSSVAARRAGHMARWFGSPRRGEMFFWGANLVLFAGLGVSLLLSSLAGVVVCFLFVFGLQSAWKPINTAAVADAGDDDALATLLSVLSQAKSLFAAALAPLLGLAVDHLAGGGLYPVPVVGVVLALVVLGVTARRRHA